MRFLLPSFTLLSCFIAPSAFGQGADVCASAQTIAGIGSFAFDNTVATTDGVPDALCSFAGQNDITNDVWFSWTAPSSATFTFATCGLTTIDSRIAIYNGACGGPILACVDDSCGPQTSIDLTVTSGNVYIIRLGNYPSAVPGIGLLKITPFEPLAVLDTRINPANGHKYKLLAGGSWSAAEATAVGLGAHLATVRSQAEHDWLTQTWHTFQGTEIDMWIGFTDQAIEGQFVWINGEPITYTNWDLNEPNNGGGIEHYGVLRQNNPAAYWNDLPNVPTGFPANPHGIVEIFSSFATPVCIGDGSGTPCPCGNNSPVGNHGGCLSSLGLGGKVDAIGTPNVSSDSVALIGTNLTNSTCLYFQGTVTLNGGLGVAFGDGLRCGGGTVIRLGIKTNVGGTSQYPAPGDPSISVKGLIPPAGGLRVYQCWYRNAAAFCTASTFNLTNGLSLTWQP